MSGDTPPLRPAAADPVEVVAQRDRPEADEALRDRPEAERPASVDAILKALRDGIALLVPADVAGPIMCSRSEASWWRDHAAGRIPAPVKLGGRTLWRVEELRRWVEAGCPDRRAWQAIQAGKNAGGQPRKGGR